MKHDYLIIGAGPAGLQLGYFLQKSERRYVILERSDRAGSFFDYYPRNRTLISFNKVHSIYDDPEIRLRWDWNSLLTDDYSFPFREYSKRLYPDASHLSQYLRDFAKHFGIHIDYGKDARRIQRLGDDGFRVDCHDGTSYTTSCLIIATGLWEPFVPEIPGIEHAEGYESVTFDPEEFEGKRVLIIGKGNSGFEIAEQILESAALIHLASPQPIRLAWQTRHPGHLRANNTRLLDMYQLKLLNGALDCDISQIVPTSEGFKATVEYQHADAEVEELVYDRVIRAAGFRFDASIFDEGCRPVLRLDERFPDMGPDWQSTTTPGCYFAGTLMQVRDFRKAGSAFIDGFRYNCRSLVHILEEKYFGVPTPHELLPLDPERIVQHVTDRVCRSSGLWTQFGFLCDAIIVDRDQRTVRYHYELPIDYVHTIPDSEGRTEYFTVSFQWGEWEGNVFEIERHPRHDRAYTNVFLHPVVRHYHRGVLAEEHHILEDLFGMYGAALESGIVTRRGGRDIETYHREEHYEPLIRFFRGQLGGPPARAHVADSEWPRKK